ncbi:hypothetical protein HH1059_19680 [Halorhodospira halochloris]|uniref:Uncharacterized protein n=1 Tax=Halorhodospira halochloris TaxID=1052 RepID=A0A2Z6EZT4_HALHR|nr:hypothetical protein HH1059_19680 [Halorhodospira halochloris]
MIAAIATVASNAQLLPAASPCARRVGVIKTLGEAKPSMQSARVVIEPGPGLDPYPYPYP